jgi:hypothetical protein
MAAGDKRKSGMRRDDKGAEELRGNIMMKNS